MKESKVQMQMETNPWAMFLSSDQVKLGENLYVPMRKLVQHFRKYCNERITDARTRSKIRTTFEAYGSAFADRHRS